MIDIYSVVTNGILTSDDSKFRIIDPLGYFVITIEEIITPPIEPDRFIDFGGGGIVEPYTVEPKRKKFIKIVVSSSEVGLQYTKEVETRDVKCTIRSVSMKEGIVVVEIYDPSLNEIYIEKINVKVL
jgi:hypothetical protein